MNILNQICFLVCIIGVKSNPVLDLTPTEPLEISSTSTPTTTAAYSSEIARTTDGGEIVTDRQSVADCSHCLPNKYLNHYYAKGCKPIFDDNCNNCPKMFDCDKKVEVIAANDECSYNGTKYQIGESIRVSDPCKVCQCGYGFAHRSTGSGYSSPFTTIHCITIECPEYFAVHNSPLRGLERDFESIKNCYDVYEPNKCCAVAKKCDDNDRPTGAKICAFEDNTYKLGQKIYPNEDKCKVCICDEEWDPIKGVNNSACNDVQCGLEIDRQLLDGCTPIYHEKTCCPIDYYCPEREEAVDFAEQCGQQFDSGPCVGSFKRFFFDVSDQLCHSFEFSGCGGNSNNYRTLEECQQTCLKLKNANQTITGDESHNTSDGQSCRFNGHIYAIGDRLDIGQTCVECRCRVPPDMTCVHQSCPSPPSDDCKVSYNPSSCCPLFDCNYNKTQDQAFDPLSCPTPMCDKRCVFETYPDRCPTCVCKPTVDDIDHKEVTDFEITDV